jgi:hypothetical protein
MSVFSSTAVAFLWILILDLYGKITMLGGGGAPTHLLLHYVCVLNVMCLLFSFVDVSCSSLCRTGNRISIFTFLCLIAYF